MAPLDRPRILQSASDEIKAARTEVMRRRGGDLSSDNSNELVLPSERNLLAEGSGLMVSSDEVVEMASQLSFAGPTAGHIFKLAETVSKRDDGRRRHMSANSDVPDLETLKERYDSMKRLTANEIVSKGDGRHSWPHAAR
jgi:hypothetical protein